MADENQFLLYATLMGVYITFFYDILRIFRRVIPHANFMVSLEDIGFWIYCSIKVFMLMYYESDGTLRWFAVLGALLGMTVYRKLVSPFFVKYLSLGFKWVLGILVKSGKFLFRPAAGRWNAEHRRKAARTWGSALHLLSGKRPEAAGGKHLHTGAA